MHRFLILALALFASVAHATVPLCPVTVGTLTLTCSTPRATGISPLLVFFDCTNTTDTATLPGANTIFQDVQFQWNFSDTGTQSGKGNWLYGAHSGYSSKNIATGAIAAHLYVVADGAGNLAPTPGAIVTATDGTNIATCAIAFDAYDPIGANGFTAANTICYSTSGTFTGCPSGATQTTTSTFSAINGNISNKRLLYRCGETFTGDNYTIQGTKWQVGAYGGCQGTQTGRPTFNDTAGTGDYAVYVGYGNSGGSSTGDGRITDISFNGNSTAGGAINSLAYLTNPIPYQITVFNVQSTGSLANFATYSSAQWGWVQDAVLNTGSHISVFFNNLANNASYWASSGSVYPNLNYMAVIGNFVNGVGPGSGGGIEAMRTPSCRLCLYENNTIENANNTGGVFKLNSSNTYQSCGPLETSISGCWPVGTPGGTGSPCTVGAVFALSSCWTGYWTELIEISDNLFQGNSGGILSDIAPENAQDDERERFLVIERNVYNSTTNQCCETLLLVTANNATIRDNGFYMPSTGSIWPVAGTIVGQRGSGNQQIVPSGDEVYNNTCIAPNAAGTPGSEGSGQHCIDIGTTFTTASPTGSFFQNNLFYEPVTATGPTVSPTGTGNTVSNNTSTVTNNPSFTNGGGSFLLMTDFKPTANYTGGVCLLNLLLDSLGVAFSPACDWGAVHH